MGESIPRSGKDTSLWLTRFRWADCQMRDLQRCPRSDDHLERLLNSLPQSLEETYERILCNVDPSSIEDAKRILTFLCFAPRPLTVKELIDGIAVEVESLRLNIGRRLQNASDIHEICSSLIDIDLNVDDATGMSGEDTLKQNIRLAHFSVEEYLKSERILHGGAAKISFNKGSAHAEIALICLIYLLEPGLSEATSIEDILENYPLAPFAAKYWYHHYERAEQQISKLDDLILELFQSDHSFVTSIKLHDPDDSRPQNGFLLSSNHIASPIYYASLLGLSQVLRQLIDIQGQQVLTADSIPLASKPKISGINAQDGEYGDALQAASYMGHEDIVRLLLEKGAQVNAEGGKYGCALQAASYMGHKTVLEVLLEEGANVNAKGGKYGNALQAACYDGHEAIIRLLIDNHANVNAEGGYFGTALQAASAEGHINVVQLLCENQANVNVRGGYFGTALEAARGEGHEQVAKFLTTKGALREAYRKAPKPSPANNFQPMPRQNAWPRGRMSAVSHQIGSNAASPRIYSSALIEAADKGHEEIIQLLIKKMTNVNAQRSYDSAVMVGPIYGHESMLRSSLLEGMASASVTALIVASHNGHEGVVRLLLETGSRADVQNEEHDSALGAAAENGHEKIAYMLIEKGADVNASGKYGTALQRASASGHENIVKLLLDKGADINAKGGKDRFERTALQEAARYGHEKIVRLLLERDETVNIDARRKNGIALQYASASGHENIAKLLLDKGADIDAPRRHDVGTAWEEARMPGHDRIMQLLLERDANAKEKYREALQFASVHGQDKIVQFLLDRDENFREKYEDALRSALAHGHENVVQLLLGRSTDMPEAYLMLLDEASLLGYESMVKFWLEKDAYLTTNGALEAASRRRHYKIVKLLVEYSGNTFYMQPEYFETALLEASRQGHENMIKLLLNYEKNDTPGMLKGFNNIR